MNTLDTEIIEPSNAIALRPSSPPALFGTTEPCEIVSKATAVADSLKSVIKKQGLISNIQGKEYPRCEAWTLLGTMLGVFPVCVWTKQVEGGWEARVEARTRDGSILGAAEAQCLRSERNWSNRDDFALRSMAQTRATAKALRMPLGFVMTLAGFEATPSEEMENHNTTPSKPVAPKFASKPSAQAETVKTPPRPIGGSNSVGSVATPEQKAKLISTIESEGPDAVQKALGYFIEAGALLPTESLVELPLNWVPTTAGQFRELGLLIAKLNDTGVVEKPAWGHYRPSAPAESANPATAFNAEEGEENPFHEPESAKTPQQNTVKQPEFTDETWRSFVVPWGKNAGKTLDKLPKNTLYGFWANFTVETEYNGKPKKPEAVAKDRAFRAALNQAGIHYQFEDANQ